MYYVMEMEDGFYINDVGVGQAFGEPLIPAGILRNTAIPFFHTFGEEL